MQLDLITDPPRRIDGLQESFRSFAAQHIIIGFAIKRAHCWYAIFTCKVLGIRRCGENRDRLRRLEEELQTPRCYFCRIGRFIVINVLNKAVAFAVLARNTIGKLIFNDCASASCRHLIGFIFTGFETRLEIRLICRVLCAHIDRTSQRIASEIRRLRTAIDLNAAEVPGIERAKECGVIAERGVIHIDGERLATTRAPYPALVDATNGKTQITKRCGDVRDALNNIIDIRDWLARNLLSRNDLNTSCHIGQRLIYLLTFDDNDVLAALGFSGFLSRCTGDCEQAGRHQQR